MKYLKYIKSTVLILAVSLISCDKGMLSNGDNGDTGIFILKSYSKIPGTVHIDETSAVTYRIPLVNYSGILSYDSINHVFTLSERAIDKIKNLKVPVNGLPFAFKIDGKIIYTAYLWPGFSSATCDWMAADPIMAEFYGGLKINLGYPGDMPGVADRRNDSRIIDLFRTDNRLK
jgi:hypothetical protein